MDPGLTDPRDLGRALPSGPQPPGAGQALLPRGDGPATPLPATSQEEPRARPRQPCPALPCVETSTEPLSTSSQQLGSPQDPALGSLSPAGEMMTASHPGDVPMPGGAHCGERGASPRQKRWPLSPKPAHGTPALSRVSLPLDPPWSPGWGEPSSAQWDGPSSQPPAPRQGEPLRASDTPRATGSASRSAGWTGRARSGRRLAVFSILDFFSLLPFPPCPRFSWDMPIELAPELPKAPLTPPTSVRTQRVCVPRIRLGGGVGEGWGAKAGGGGRHCLWLLCFPVSFAGLVLCIDS